MFKVICIDASDRPNDIPTSRWVKKDQTYTVIEVSKMNQQQGKLGFKLAEIDLSGCFPYLYFSANRFRMLQDVDELKESNIEELTLETA